MDRKLSPRAEELFQSQREAIFRHTDGLFMWLMLAQWIFGVAVSLWLSPFTWSGSESSLHPHVWAAIVLGGIITAFPVFMGWKFPGHVLTRHSFAVAQMFYGALLIHLTGGRIETHFHIFGSLAFLAFYRDGWVLVTASAVVLADHFLRGMFWPESVYGAIAAPMWRSFEHAGWVVFEDIFLIAAICKSLTEMRRVAYREAELESINAEVEKRVAIRTRELAVSEELFRSLSETAPVAIFRSDEKGRVIFANKRWAELSGQKNGEWLGDGWLNAMHPEDRDTRRSNWADMVKHQTDYENDLRIMLPSGEVRWLQGRAKPLFLTDGKFAGHVGTVEDFTESKRTLEDLAHARDAALESARLKSEFLANMSHEIRTPLNAVLGMTSLLQDTPLTEEQKEFVTTAHRSADSLLVLLNDILDFSKIEAGRLSFQEEDFDLRETLEESLEMLAESAQSKGIELMGYLLPNVPSQLRGDDGRLRQVLLNLIGNAIKFTESGEVVARIFAEGYNDDVHTLRFEIEDTGIGIPPDSQHRLFQAFTQVDGSTTRRYGGTGLGLVISQRLVDMMGGQISFTSKPDKGTIFSFTAQFRSARSLVVAEPVSLQSLHSAKILVVDDNATNRLILHHQLAQWHIRDTHATNAEEALALLRQHAADKEPFDAVILDMQMPGIDGLQLAEAIEQDTQLRGLPKIVLTSLGSRISSDLMRKAGITDWLLKPVRQKRLLEGLARALNTPVATPEKQERPIAPRNLPINPLRILLAEDNPVNQKVVLLQLKRLGYHADIAVNGLEAVRATETNTYDIILMDCQMPEMEGYEAARKIREREARLSSQHRTRIIAVTANAMEGEKEKCLNAGMDDYLTKPLRLADLSAILSYNEDPADSLEERKQ
jgi:two-component system sensor histidine kinase/response regulator